MIPEEIKNQILAASRIEDVAKDFFELKKSGVSFYCDCPKCGKSGKGKGLSFSPAKQIYKCFSCDFSGNSAASLLMETQDMSFPAALKWLAQKYHIIIDEGPKAKGPQRKNGKTAKTFCDMQLDASGLEAKDVQAKVYVDEKTEKLVPIYEAGTRDQYGRIAPGDDMIIWYYDLDGKPTLFKREKANKFDHLYRIRWKIPELHPDRHGQPIKYQSPPSSGSHLYIPEAMRRIYKDGRIIKRLYVQEGEKKAEKACLHGLPSVGIMGIHNIASQGRLPHDLQLIVQVCQVEEVVFVLDADWDHLSENLKPGDRVDMRTASFYLAVRNFRDYFKAFNNMGIYLETYFSYIKTNEKKDKGIDDLLANTLKGKENELYNDFNEALNNIKEKNGEGEYVQVNKITTLTDFQISQFWGAENSKSFLKKYKEVLQENFPNGEMFKIGRLEWRFNQEKNDFEPAQPLGADEQYWEEIKWEDARGGEKKKLQFDYVNLKNFLRNRGFGKIRMASGKYLFASMKGKVIRNVESQEIKDYVVEFTEEIAPKDVQNLLLRGAKMYLGPDSLGNMGKVEPVFNEPERYVQHLYFKEKYWVITDKTIDEKPLNQLLNYIWEDKIIDFNASLASEPLLKIEEFTQEILEQLPPEKQLEYKHFVGQYDIELTETGNKCDFLVFLRNASEFAWRKLQNPQDRKPLQEDGRSIDEKFETNMHLLSKLTAIGYQLHEYHDPSTSKAVIYMDGKMSEVGQSNGRTGKSLVGKFVGQIIPQVVVPSKSKKLTEDPFLFEGVSEKTRSVFFDDVRVNIDLEFFYPYITGPFAVRPLGEKRFFLPEKIMPKISFSSNHGFDDGSGSLRDRMFPLAFSDYYNESWKPINDFNVSFITEWDESQWNLAYNLAATCLQLYFKYGLVKAPLRRLEMRNLRQRMGETFLNWADEYFSDPNHINEKLARGELTEDYLKKVPSAARYYTPHSFKDKLSAYCEFRELKLNPQLYDPDGNPRKYDKRGRPIEFDKSGGVEFFTIANDEYVTPF